MANRQTDRHLVRIDGKPFQSPRGRGRGNPGWGRENGMPFVSQRGRGRVIPLGVRPEVGETARSGFYEDIMHVDTIPRTFDPLEEHSEHNAYDVNDLRAVQPNMMSSDGRLFYCGLPRIDNKPFESPRGRGRNNPGWGRAGGIPFVSKRERGNIYNHQNRSVNTYAASAPSYEAIMDVE